MLKVAGKIAAKRKKSLEKQQRLAQKSLEKMQQNANSRWKNCSG